MLKLRQIEPEAGDVCYVGPRGAAGPLVVVSEQHRGRATGHGVACEDHGAMPVLRHRRDLAIAGAWAHLKSEHGDAGRVLVRAPSQPRRKRG